MREIINFTCQHFVLKEIFNDGDSVEDYFDDGEDKADADNLFGIFPPLTGDRIKQNDSAETSNWSGAATNPDYDF